VILHHPEACATHLAKFREDVPAQPVDATPLWLVDLTMGSSGPIVRACGSLLPKQDAFSLHLCSRTF